MAAAPAAAVGAAAGPGGRVRRPAERPSWTPTRPTDVRLWFVRTITSHNLLIPPPPARNAAKTEKRNGLTLATLEQEP